MEIYQRLATLLQQDHRMTTFAIYELNHQKHPIIPILVDGVTTPQDQQHLLEYVD